MTTSATVPEVPTRWSYSSWSKYAQCGHAYKLEKVDRIPTQPMVAGCGGRAFHTWSEWVDWGLDVDADAWDDFLAAAVEAEMAATSTTPDTWKVTGRASKANPNKEDLDWWLFAGREMCVKYLEWRDRNAALTIVTDLPEDKFDNNTGIEYALDLEMPDGIDPLVGFIDRVYEDPVEGIGIVDVKTGSRVRKWMQAVFYSAGMRELGIDVRWAAFYDARKGELTEKKPLSHWSLAKVATVIAPQDQLRKQRVFPVVPGDYCSWCGSRPECSYAI